MFVSSDFNSIHIGTVTQAIITPYLSGYTMLLKNENDPETYGRMLSWDEDSNAFDMMSRSVGIQPGEGLLVMEIQKRKMEFLLSCTKVILQDLNLNASDIPRQPYKEEDMLARSNSEWQSLTMEMLEAPYRVPDRFEISKLKSFVNARRNQAIDHVWALREDPSYFQDTVLEWSEHRQEKILTADGRAHPVLRKDLFWERVVGNMIVHAYTDFLIWHGLLEEIEEVRKIATQIAAKTKAHDDLPRSMEFENAISHFSYFVENATKDVLETWKVAMVASPPLRKHFARAPQDPTNTRIQVTGKSSSASRKDNLLWLMERFTMDQQVFLFGTEYLCDELEREVRSNPANRERISGYMASLISDLSLLGEFKRQIDLRSNGPLMVEDVEEDVKKAEFERKTSLLRRIYEVLSKHKDLASSALPLSKFNHHSYKRRTKAVTDKMQQAERELDIFWAEVDDQCTKKCGKTVHQLLGDALDHYEVERVSDWQPVESEVRSQIKDLSTEAALNHVGSLHFGTTSKDTINPKPSQLNIAKSPGLVETL